MAKYFFCNKFVNEMFLGCNIKNLFGSWESRALYYASVCFRHGYCIQIIALILVIMGDFINVLVSKGNSNLIPEKDNLYGQFVGEWDFEWVDNQGTTGERHVQGEWIFAWVLEGTAIQDVFICPSRKARIKDYQPDAAYATAVRMYNPNTEAWDILYTELGGATQLEGKREGNRIVQTEINEKNIQWVFSEITTTSFRWQRMVKRPDGTWETEAELFAVRR